MHKVIMDCPKYASINRHALAQENNATVKGIFQEEVDEDSG